MTKPFRARRPNNYKTELLVISCGVIALTFGLLLPPKAQAHDIPSEITSIYWSDGDSGWINGRKDGFAFRLADIDAPETRSTKIKGGAKCEAERERGYAAKAFVVEATKDAKLIIPKYHYHDRYDRHVIDLSANGRDVAQSGLKAGHYGSWKFKNKLRADLTRIR